MTLKEKFNTIAAEYIAAFEKKQDVYFDGWIGDDVGGIANISDYFIYFGDIRYDIDNNIPVGVIFKWCSHMMDVYQNGEDVNRINYPNFTKSNLA